MCSDLFGDHIANHDAFLVRRLREAGFVIVGKTALPEMGILPTTESRRFGPTHNPWALDRTPGGSSGGSAAAVAAGMVPIAHGNDGGGSTRIPAACCGLVGLKATRDRVSVGPDGGRGFLVADGVLTRTVAESGALLDILAGYEPGDASWAPPVPPGAFAAAAARSAGPAGRPPPDRPRPQLPPRGGRARPRLRAGRTRRRRAARVARPLGAGDHRPVVRPRPSPRLLPRLRTRRGDDRVRGLADRSPRGDGGRRRAADLGALAPRPRTGHGHLPGRRRPPRVLARRIVAELAQYDVVLTPGPGAPATAHRRGARPRSRRLGPLSALGPVHALHRDRQRNRPACRLVAALPRRGRAAPSGPADRPARRGGGAAGPERPARGGAPLGRAPG